MKTELTANQELPTQIVIDFFTHGIPITSAPKDIVLKKSNAAIRVLSSLSLLERKIIDACFYIARPKMTESNIHTADMEYFKWLISFNSQNRDHLKKSITKIQQTLIQINIVDEANPTKDFWHSTNFLYDVSITNGQIYFRIPESIRQSLLNPKSWTYLSFRIKNRFTSEYAYILYERCRAAQFMGATEWWTIDEFRAVMNASNIYSAFQDLQKRVIKPGIEQINALSDIFVIADYKTKGRTKTHIRFIIEVNPNVKKFTEEKEKLPSALFETLKNTFGLSNSQIDEVAEYPLEYLSEKIEFTLFRMHKGKKRIDRPDSYLLKALREDLRFNESDRKSIAVAPTTIRNGSDDQTSKDSASYADHLTAFERFMSPEQKEAIINEFTNSESFMAIKSFVGGKKFSLTNPMVRAAFGKYLKDKAVVGVDGFSILES
jgi:hypothetical protein